MKKLLYSECIFLMDSRTIRECHSPNGKANDHRCTGLLRTNTVAAKRDLLAERTVLGKSVSVSLRKNGPK